MSDREFDQGLPNVRLSLEQMASSFGQVENAEVWKRKYGNGSMEMRRNSV